MRVYAIRPFAVAFLLALAGCGMFGETRTPALPLADAVALTTEKDGRFVSLIGPGRQHADPFLGVPQTNFYTLRSAIDTKTGESVHQLYVEDSYAGAERNWNAAHDGQGRVLRFIPISKNEITCGSGCSYAEEFAAALPEAMLRANPQGFTIVFAAKSGDQMKIDVPGDLVKKQLTALDAARAQYTTAAK
jgi:hypothetical protein